MVLSHFPPGKLDDPRVSPGAPPAEEENTTILLNHLQQMEEHSFQPDCRSYLPLFINAHQCFCRCRERMDHCHVRSPLHPPSLAFLTDCTSPQYKGWNSRKGESLASVGSSERSYHPYIKTEPCDQDTLPTCNCEKSSYGSQP